MPHSAYAHKQDSNQWAIVDAYKQVGATPAETSRLGGGFPDLVVGSAQGLTLAGAIPPELRQAIEVAAVATCLTIYPGVNLLVEVKTPDGWLNEKQAKFHAAWRGPILVVTSREAARRSVGMPPKAKHPA